MGQFSDSGSLGLFSDQTAQAVWRRCISDVSMHHPPACLHEAPRWRASHTGVFEKTPVSIGRARWKGRGGGTRRPVDQAACSSSSCPMAGATRSAQRVDPLDISRADLTSSKRPCIFRVLRISADSQDDPVMREPSSARVLEYASSERALARWAHKSLLAQATRTMTRSHRPIPRTQENGASGYHTTIKALARTLRKSIKHRD